MTDNETSRSLQRLRASYCRCASESKVPGKVLDDLVVDGLSLRWVHDRDQANAWSRIEKIDGRVYFVSVERFSKGLGTGTGLRNLLVWSSVRRTSPSDGRRMGVRRMSDGRRTSDGSPSDVRRTSDGRPADAQRTSDGSPTEVRRRVSQACPGRRHHAEEQNRRSHRSPRRQTR